MADLNPFARAEKETAGAPAIVESNRTAQTVQAMVILAKKFPRDQKLATERILLACQRYTLAREAVYSFPRGNTMVSGPSIRLAEAIAREWGNLDFGIIELDRKGDESTMLAYAWDLETNVQTRVEYKVRHYRDTKKEKIPLHDERDIYEMVANQGARRLRSCILRLIPGDVTEEAVAQCEETIQAEVKDLPEAIKNMVEAFEQFGVTKSQIEKRLRHRIESTNAAEIVALRKVCTSISDGMAKPEDYFEVEPKEETPVEKTKDKARTAAKKAAATMAGEDETGIPDDL
jgi:hypothetical protein